MQTGQSLASSRWAASHCPWPPVTARSPADLRGYRLGACLDLACAYLDVRHCGRHGSGEASAWPWVRICSRAACRSAGGGPWWVSYVGSRCAAAPMLWQGPSPSAGLWRGCL